MRSKIALLGLWIGACGVTEGQVFTAPDAAPLAAEPPSTDAGTDAGPDAEVDATVGSGTEDAGPPLDASFEWEEEVPGRGTCRMGRYVGTFMCPLSATPGVALEGQISFTLAGSEESRILEVTDGTLSDLNGFLEAGFTGTLDCQSEAFEGHAIDGRAYAIPASGTPGERIPSFQFDASFTGFFDPQKLIILGPWSMFSDLGNVCYGGWGVAAAP